MRLALLFAMLLLVGGAGTYTAYQHHQTIESPPNDIVLCDTQPDDPSCKM